jgi:hypothetical protein
VVYRPARAQDLARADELVVASINDLTERHGFGAIAVSRPTNFQSFSLQDDAGGLWVAEDAADRRLRLELGLRRPVVSCAALRFARSSGKRHWQ